MKSPREHQMFYEVYGYSVNFRKLFWKFGFTVMLLVVLVQNLFSQQFNQAQYGGAQPSNQNYLRNSSAFRQEIARFEITVTREGLTPLSLSQVPRVQKSDILKVKLLDEAVNGIKPDQSLYDWTLLVAFINPNRKITDKDDSPHPNELSKDQNADRNKKSAAIDERQSSVSQEIQFRKTGWYREYSFTVPYDSQPVFFLYPRPKYRDKILKLINKNYNEVRKLGEKTIEIAGAYAQISAFLNNLQGVLSGNSYNYGSFGSSYGTGYNNYGNYGNYNNYNYGAGNYGYYNNTTGYNYNQLMSQTIEMLARSFNIQLPSNCWQGGSYNGYNSSYNSFGYGSSGLNNYGISQDLISKVQCIAKNVRLEDFDLSVARILQQGGVVVAAQLAQKYPQLIYWINLAAAAIDFIVKISKKALLRIVPAVAWPSDNPNSSGNYNSSGYPGNYNAGYPDSTNSPATAKQPIPKISLFAENQPDDSQFVTAYPIVLHKWQAEADPEIISLRQPILAEPCLHVGLNILKSTDLTDDQLADNFTKDYTLTINSANGFKKEFPLKKNIGLGGWELNITPQDLQEFPRIRMNLEAVIKGTRGFNEIKSPPFYLPISIGGSWEITSESQKELTAGGRRTVTLRNNLGNCQCLQSVIYKPAFGGQFVFAVNNREHGLQYSPDGSEVSFDLDTAGFLAGAGEIELRTFGGESAKLNLKLYPSPPIINYLQIGKGDREALISGERLEQIQSVTINGRRAYVVGSQGLQDSQSYQGQPSSVSSNSENSPAPGSYISGLQASGPGERIIVFADANAKLTENTATLELALEDNRTIQIKQAFPVAPSRPKIVANENREIEGTAIDTGKEEITAAGKSKIGIYSGKRRTGIKSKAQLLPLSIPDHQLSTNPTFSIETGKISLNVRNYLTDFDFRIENLSIETRLEPGSNNNSSTFNSIPSGENPGPKIEFEVLDWKNIRLTFELNGQLQKMLGGRRLQFRIRDKERGDSDWYSIKQTFVRIPEIKSISCTAEMNGMCEMKGAGIDYISQISIDGGQNWFPAEPATLQTQPAPDGQRSAIIPFLQNKEFLRIRLRDFPKGEGLFVDGFNFSNTLKRLTKTISGNK